MAEGRSRGSTNPTTRSCSVDLTADRQPRRTSVFVHTILNIDLKHRCIRVHDAAELLRGRESDPTRPRSSGSNQGRPSRATTLSGVALAALFASIVPHRPTRAARWLTRTSRTWSGLWQRSRPARGIRKTTIHTGWARRTLSRRSASAAPNAAAYGEWPVSDRRVLSASRLERFSVPVLSRPDAAARGRCPSGRAWSCRPRSGKFRAWAMRLRVRMGITRARRRSASVPCDEAARRAWGHDHVGHRRRASQSALACCQTAGTSQTTASGGSITSAEAACPCHGIGSASMPLGFPAFEPP